MTLGISPGFALLAEYMKLSPTQIFGLFKYASLKPEDVTTDVILQVCGDLGFMNPSVEKVANLVAEAKREAPTKMFDYLAQPDKVGEFVNAMKGDQTSLVSCPFCKGVFKL